MAQWREQCRLAGRTEILLPTPEWTPAPLTLPEPPLPTLFPLPIPLLTLFPNWPNEPTSSLIALELPLPCPQGNNIVMTLCQLNTAREGLTDKVLLEWALDVLCSPEDWRWLWSLEPATTPSLSPTPNQLHSLWYGVFNANPSSTFTLNAPNTYAPFVEEQH